MPTLCLQAANYGRRPCGSRHESDSTSLVTECTEQQETGALLQYDGCRVVVVTLCTKCSEHTERATLPSDGSDSVSRFRPLWAQPSRSTPRILTRGSPGPTGHLVVQAGKQGRQPSSPCSLVAFAVGSCMPVLWKPPLTLQVLP